MDNNGIVLSCTVGLACKPLLLFDYERLFSELVNLAWRFDEGCNKLGVI